MVACFLLPAFPAQAAEPFTAVEERQILQGLEELVIIREEVLQLRDIQANQGETVTALKGNVAALERLVEIQEQMIQTALKISDLQMKALATYAKMVELAEKRAEAAEARAERAEKYMIFGPIIGMIVGALLVAIFL